MSSSRVDELVDEIQAAGTRRSAMRQAEVDKTEAALVALRERLLPDLAKIGPLVSEHAPELAHRGGFVPLWGRSPADNTDCDVCTIGFGFGGDFKMFDGLRVSVPEAARLLIKQGRTAAMDAFDGCVERFLVCVLTTVRAGAAASA